MYVQQITWSDYSSTNVAFLGVTYGEVERKVVDEEIESSELACRGIERWDITDYAGDRWWEMAEQAITLAKCTGSVGATSSIGGDGQDDSRATVRRVA